MKHRAFLFSEHTGGYYCVFYLLNSETVKENLGHYAFASIANYLLYSAFI